MDNYIQVLLFVIIAIILLWLGLMFFFRLKGKNRGHYQGSSAPESGGSQGSDLFWERGKHKSPVETGKTKTCPVCSANLPEGEQVKTVAFPAFNNSKDRMMHIHGCVFCLPNMDWKAETNQKIKNRPPGSGGRKRICPVCKAVLAPDDFLAARIFERALRKNHVHVLGCSRCRKVK